VRNRFFTFYMLYVKKVKNIYSRPEVFLVPRYIFLQKKKKIIHTCFRYKIPANIASENSKMFIFLIYFFTCTSRQFACSYWYKQYKTIRTLAVPKCELFVAFNPFSAQCIFFKLTATDPRTKVR